MAATTVRPQHWADVRLKMTADSSRSPESGRRAGAFYFLPQGRPRTDSQPEHPEPRQHHPIAGEVRRVCSSLVPEKSRAPATPKSLEQLWREVAALAPKLTAPSPGLSALWLPGRKWMFCYSLPRACERILLSSPLLYTQANRGTGSQCGLPRLHHGSMLTQG